MVKEEDKLELEELITDALYDFKEDLKNDQDHTPEFIIGGVILFVVLNLVWGLFSWQAIDRVAKRDPEIQYQTHTVQCLQVQNEKGQTLREQCTEY